MNKATLKLLWGRWYVKAAVASVVVVALLAVAGYVALKPTYTADEVAKKIETYLRGKAYLSKEEKPGGNRSCYQQRALGVGLLDTPHYIPYRKAWRITTVSSSNYTWLFDERTGTIASSDPRC